MKWLSVIVAALSLAREIVKYLSEKEKNKKKRAKKLVVLKNGFKEARKEGDTSKIETAFTKVGIDLGVGGNKLSDDEKII
jgi:hypothetical protein